MMKERTEHRIKRILADYHPTIEPGEEAMTFEEAKRLIEVLMKQGHSEEEAFDCLKYCTVGEEYQEMESCKLKDREAMEIAKDTRFYAKMAMRKASHVGLLVLALNVFDKAKRNHEDMTVAKTVYAIAATLFILDNVEVLIKEIKGMRCLR